MPLFELQAPDGAVYEVEAPDERTAFAAFQKMAGAPQQPQQGLPDWARAFATAQGVDPSSIPAVTDRDIAAHGKRGDDLVRSIASGATFGLADELAAGMRTLAGSQPYSQNLAEERARDASISPLIRIPGEIAGGVMTGLGASRAGLTALNAARPTVGNMALRGAAEGAAYGAAHGFGRGEGGFGERASEAGRGALVGALAGGVTGAVAGKMAQSAGQKAAPTPQQLRAQSDAAYASAKQAGLAVRPDRFGEVVARIEGKAKVGGLDKTLHPNTTRALERLAASREEPLTLQELDTLRQVVSDAWKNSAPKSGDARLARKVLESFDDFLDNLKPSDIAAGDPKKAIPILKEARDFWSRFRKAETVSELLQRAEDRASQFSGSGLENAIRTEFRQLLMNKKRLRGFTPDEVEAIRRVVRGGPVDNALRMLGKLAPTGVVSGGIGSAIGAALGSAVGGPGGAAVGSVAVPALGAAARQGATAATRGNVDALAALVRSGGNIPAGSLTPAQRALIEALLIGQAQQGPGLLERAFPSPVPR